MGRGLQAVGIHHIVAESLQAEEQIERLWNTLQDRPVVELALVRITTMAEGDAALVTTFGGLRRGPPRDDDARPLNPGQVRARKRR